MKILYVGELSPTSTCTMRAIAFEELGHQLTRIDFSPPAPVGSLKDLYQRVRYRLGYHIDYNCVNERIIESCAADSFNMLWIDKGLSIRPKTLRRVRGLQPRMQIVGYSVDDMSARHNNSRYFLNGLHLYDIFFTTKTYGVAEMKAMGAPRVAWTGNAYSPHIHRPVPVSQADRMKFGNTVGFIGTYEAPRAQSMSYLADKGISIRVFGNDWPEETNKGSMRVEGFAVEGDDYARTICATDINLGFLRKMNRDLQTQRSIEIPACGGFMLAERTAEHQEMFDEGKEAEFFGSDQELLEKVRYYLEHPVERERIALAGRERCHRGGYSYHDRLKQALAEVSEAISDRSGG